eukprot:372933_1
MSFDDIAAIFLYSTSLLFTRLNASLRKKRDEWAPFCGPFLAGLSKLPVVCEKLLYRGCSSTFVVEMVKRSYKVGDIVHWDSFRSTNVQHKVAKMFCGSTGVIFEIENAIGVDINPLCAIKSSSGEIVLNPSSHFRITNIIVSGQITVVKLKALSLPWDSKAVLWVDDTSTNNE